jgi:predicted deacetylase
MGHYLIRFDDICPTMNHAKWARLEALMERYGIKPIAAIVPDNRDPELQVCAPDPNFWQRMNELQSRGWTIALHGYEHQCSALGRSLVPLHDTSEFAGAPADEQRRKIEAGVRILHSHGLKPSTWVAPRHGFDAVTVSILREFGVRIISDGLSPYPSLRGGTLWIPQQLWRTGFPRKSGVWTICVHGNEFTESDFAALEYFLRGHHREFLSVDQVQQRYGNRRHSFVDGLFESYQLARLRGRRLPYASAIGAAVKRLRLQFAR